MVIAAEQAIAAKQTTLQRTLITALNELGLDPALVAILEREGGPLGPQVVRGFTPRDVQAIIRVLSAQELSLLTAPNAETLNRASGNSEEDGSRAVRLRMITPGAKSLLAIPLRYKQRKYGMLVIGRKESAAFSKKEKALLESASEEITTALERSSLFDDALILSRPLVTQEPVPPPPPSATESYATPTSYATLEMQERVVALLKEAAQTVSFDRAWVTAYDPIAGAVEVLGISGEQKAEQKKDLKPGHRLAL
ncbi:MAG: hypothetical protein C4293_21245, partial [Nitrospiraceae bacterium]